MIHVENLEAIFKAYDVRGRVPDQLNGETAFAIGRAYCEYLQPKSVAVGRDIRLSSPEIAGKLIEGLRAGGANVVDIGLCGTEQVYFATFHFKLSGGIMVTASHNPANDNGLKMVREEAKPLSGDSGLQEIKKLIQKNFLSPVGMDAVVAMGNVEKRDVMPEYVAHLLRPVNLQALKPLRIVCNAGNGVAGPTLDALAKRLPFEFIRVQHQADGTFPNGVPNPLLPEKREVTARAVREAKADFGIAWDGDFDRCFFFDENGAFIDGYYIVGLLAGFFLRREPGAKIVHDPRLLWDTIEVVQGFKGVPIRHKSGHAFMKERMRLEDAVYGGETSAHHYFRDFGYCDSGMLPWLVVAQILSESGKKCSALVAERQKKFPVSGEINTTVAQPQKAIQGVREHYEKEALSIDFVDGISLEFRNWRFNLRLSNTEPLVRLNVETRGDVALLQEKTQEILNLLNAKSK